MQDMINGLLIVLIPMVLGYLLKVNNKSYIAKINHIVMFLLYIILFLMGYLLGQLNDLEHKLPIIGTTALTLSAIILGSNIDRSDALRSLLTLLSHLNHKVKLILVGIP